MLVCVSQPPGHIDPNTHLRRPGVLAGTEAFVEGAVCMVAKREGSDPEIASPPSAVAAGGGEPGGDGGAGVARGEHVNEIGGLRSIPSRATLGHARGVEISGPRD